MNWSLGQTNRVQEQNERRTVDPQRVRAARNGDTVAYRQIYDACAPAVHALLLAHSPIDVVEDLMQETFSSAWSDLPKLREESRFASWVMGIARNKVRRHFRRMKNQNWLPLDHEPVASTECGGPPWHTPEFGGAGGVGTGVESNSSIILAAIHSFPARERELLTLRLIEEMATGRIAEALDLKADSVKVQLSRAMAKLRQRLDGRLSHDG